MRFMNRYDIEEACARHRVAVGSVKSDAARVLRHLMEQADQVSDGWAYWPKPARAAEKMMVVLESPVADRGDYRKALVPIKAFYTKWGNKAGMAPLPGDLL